MKIRKSYNVMGHDYQVHMVRAEEMCLGKAKKDVQLLSSGQMGECEHPTRIIRLNKDYGRKLIELTLIHELRHAYQFEMGWPQILHQQLLEIDCESFVSFYFSLRKQGI